MRIGRGRERRSAAAAMILSILAALILAFATAPRVAAAPAEDPESSTGAGSGEGASAAADSESAPPGNRYVAEIIDTAYTVGAAEFFALDLPAVVEGANADHLSGTISMAEKKGDIIVRVFRSADYPGWLKKRDLQHSNPLWSSKRARTINVDLDLPPGTPITLLLDNGYSIRTPKKVHLQLQMQYVSTGPAPPATPEKSAGSAEDDIVTPRSNTEEESPPPPPPPPDEGKQ